jgi:archaellum component FlaC
MQTVEQRLNELEDQIESVRAGSVESIESLEGEVDELKRNVKLLALFVGYMIQQNPLTHALLEGCDLDFDELMRLAKGEGK